MALEFAYYQTYSKHVVCLYIFKLPEIAEGNVQAATDRMEQMILQSIASLASLVYLPQDSETLKDGKKKVSIG